jgi:acetyl-CoA carboxylase biotin carboxyl carrier protein
VEIKQIKELMAAMGRTGMKRLTVKNDTFELQLERQENGRMVEQIGDSLDDVLMRQEASIQRTAAPLGRTREQPVIEMPEEIAGTYVTSPMVGTFYASPSPDDPHFVKVGDKIEKHSVVCIIEAMKVMNEVKAGAGGTIAEILVESGHPVEFGTKLFRIT